MGRVLYLTVAVAAALLVPAGSHADEPARIRVIAVGVGRYLQGHLAALPYASEGARKVARAMRDAQPDAVREEVFTTDLPDAAQLPTALNVLRSVSALRRRVASGDLVIFYFCGHGIEIEGQQYLLPMDADLGNEFRDKATIRLADLRAMLESIPCAGKLLWLDACRETAEGLRRAGGPPSGGERAVWPWLRDGGRWQVRPGAAICATLFACREGERVYYGSKGESYFTEALVDALSGKAATPEGAVTLRSLAAYLEAAVPRAVHEDQGQAVTQRPVLVALPEFGDVLLRPAPREYIAVLPFEGAGGDIVAEMVHTRLQQSAKLYLVERARLARVLQELKLQHSGLIAPDQVQAIGELTGAHKVIIGSAKTGLDGRVALTARMVDVETGESIPGIAAMRTCDRTRYDASAVGLADDLIARMRGIAAPAGRPEVEPMGLSPDSAQPETNQTPDDRVTIRVYPPHALTGRYDAVVDADGKEVYRRYAKPGGEEKGLVAGKPLTIKAPPGTRLTIRMFAVDTRTLYKSMITVGDRTAVYRINPDMLDSPLR